MQLTAAQTEHDKRMAELRQNLEAAQFITSTGYNDIMGESEVRQDPCTLYDDEEWYTAFNQKAGRQGDPQLANSLLRTCQQQLKDKLSGKVQQVTNSYFDQMDINAQSSMAEHIEGASQMVVEEMINETMEYCRKTSKPDPQGNFIMYMSIRVKKQNVVDHMVKAASSSVSANAESKVRFNERKFREEAMKVFNEQ